MRRGARRRRDGASSWGRAGKRSSPCARRRRAVRGAGVPGARGIVRGPRRGSRASAPGSIGWAKWKPWPNSQPRSRRRRSCSSSSMPSATTSSASVLPSATTALERSAASRRCVGTQEGAVHLDDVHGEAAEVAERRVAGAEVVHRDAHAERAQLLQLDDGDLGILDEHRLGDLERQQAAGRGPTPRARRWTSATTSLCWSCLTREVHAHVQRRRIVSPALHRRRLPAGFAQNPAADRDDQPGLLGEGDEVAGIRPSPRSGCCQRSSASMPLTRPSDRRTIGW